MNISEDTHHLDSLQKMREKWIWTHFVLMMLGVWLISSPLTFDYKSQVMDWSDIVSGLLVLILSGAALLSYFDFMGRWIIALVGIWLEFAPLLFWAPTSTAYLNDTLVGVFVIAFSILIPPTTRTDHVKSEPEIPPGWSYNPSSWLQRASLIALTFICWLIARYLAAFQLGYIQTIEDPFFGEGTAKVLTSKISQALPVSDAGLGALAYSLEMLMGWKGDKARWRTMPWMVVSFFILVVPLGMISILLVMLQPVVVGHWCTLCLVTAGFMLVMILFAIDEIVATGQFLAESVRKGHSFWHTFWSGRRGQNQERQQRLSHETKRRGIVSLMMRGVTIPWNLLVSAILGIWIMATPAIFDIHDSIADSDHIVGALIVTVSVITMAEVIRAGRFLNIPFGIWLLIVPWALAGATVAATWNHIMIGLALLLFSFRRGPIREQYGSWNRYMF